MDEGAQTVPNFLRRYNPAIVGGSLSHHVIEVRGRGIWEGEWRKVCGGGARKERE